MVLDIMLPRPQWIRSAPPDAVKKVWIPVLMLTAKDGEYNETDAFDLGADDYPTKPFSFQVLVVRRGHRSGRWCSLRGCSRLIPLAIWCNGARSDFADSPRIRCSRVPDAL